MTIHEMKRVGRETRGDLPETRERATDSSLSAAESRKGGVNKPDEGVKPPPRLGPEAVPVDSPEGPADSRRDLSEEHGEVEVVVKSVSTTTYRIRSTSNRG